MRFARIFALFIVTTFFTGTLAGCTAATNEPFTADAGAIMRQIALENNYLARIHTLQPTSRNPRNPNQPAINEAIGTGILFRNTDGELRIATVNHVLGPTPDTATIWVTFGSGFGKAEIVGRDPAADLALLKVPAWLTEGVEPARFNFSNDLQVGDTVFATGFPFGMENTTFGFITALKERELEDPFPQWLYVTTQAPVNSGNSGGPLLNRNREVVAINESIISTTAGSGMAFSVTAYALGRLLPRLERGGVVEHVQLDFSVRETRDVSPIFYEYYTGKNYPPPEEGVMVYEVFATTSRASFVRPGDLVKEIRFGEKVHVVTTRQAFEEFIFFEVSPNTRGELVLKRGSELLIFQL
ncbi:MAG: serine protease [Parcubacteria group bacterium]|nr:serine protease [Parcubacteria group bacterium]